MDNKCNAIELWLICCLMFWSVAATAAEPASTRRTEGWPARPAELDESAWDGLKDAYAKATQQARLVAANGSSNDRFGTSVAISGSTALIGAASESMSFERGLAYVFVRDSTGWSQQARLTARGLGPTRSFSPPALSGDTALLGTYEGTSTPPFSQGVIYVYVRNGTTWSLETNLYIPTFDDPSVPGMSISMSGDTAVVASPHTYVGGNTGQGAAHVFVRGRFSWVEQARLTEPDGPSIGMFGRAVAISGDTILVGALDTASPGPAGKQSSAYVFVRNGSTWAHQAKLVGLDRGTRDWFGRSVALSEDTAVVGAPWHAEGANATQGAAYVFVRSGTTWAQQARLLAADGQAGDQFGYSVAVSGERVLVGSVGDDLGANSNQGSAYLYERMGTDWVQRTKIVGTASGAGSSFGNAVALSNATALVGAIGERVGEFTNQGATYAYDTGNGGLSDAYCGGNTVTIRFWDPSAQDGDTVNVSLDGVPLVSNFNLDQCGGPNEPLAGACSVSRALLPGSSSTLRVTAVNEGSAANNAGALRLIGGCAPERQNWTLAATETAQVVITQDPDAGAVPTGTPTNVVARSLDGGAMVSFTPPASDGGSPIMGYVVSATPGDSTRFFSELAESYYMGGLTNGITYRFTVRARNVAGDGPQSAPSNPVTPDSVAQSAPGRAYDINGDGRTDLLWYNIVSGSNYYQLRAGPSVIAEDSLLVHPTWRVVASGDLDADGRADLLWYNSATGQTHYWLMDGPLIRMQGNLFGHPHWRITHSADLNADGRADLLWINPATGETHGWLMNGIGRTSAGNLLVHPTWRVTHTGDLNGDRRGDLVWYDEATGESYFWLMNGMTRIGQGSLLVHPIWRVVAVGDLNADGSDDLLWHNRTTGESNYWLMSGGTPIAQGTLLIHPSWVITGTADVNGDGRVDLLWFNPASSESYLWIMSGVTPSLQLSISTDPRWRTINP